jgi:hypothetical protein
MQILHVGLKQLFACWPECKLFPFARMQFLHAGQTEIFAFSRGGVHFLHAELMQNLHAS